MRTLMGSYYSVIEVFETNKMSQLRVWAHIKDSFQMKVHLLIT